MLSLKFLCVCVVLCSNEVEPAERRIVLGLFGLARLFDQQSSRVETQAPLVQFSVSLHVPHQRHPNLPVTSVPRPIGESFVSSTWSPVLVCCLSSCMVQSSATSSLDKSHFSLFLRGFEKHCSSCVFDIFLPNTSSECVATSSVGRSNSPLSVFPTSMFGAISSDEFIASALIFCRNAQQCLGHDVNAG